jgi:cytochrome c
MRKWFNVSVLAVSLMLPFLRVSHAGEQATPQECIQKCQEAAKFLSEEAAKGPEAEKAALASLNQKENNRFVWKDTYVWVLCCDCEPKTNAAHPINQKIVGPDLSGMKDKQGNLFFLQFCDASKNPKGGWVEYWWPKLDEKKASRKITYVVKVPGTKYQVGAGVYDDSMDAQNLNKLIK